MFLKWRAKTVNSQESSLIFLLPFFFPSVFERIVLLIGKEKAGLGGCLVLLDAFLLKYRNSGAKEGDYQMEMKCPISWLSGKDEACHPPHLMANQKQINTETKKKNKNPKNSLEALRVFGALISQVSAAPRQSHSVTASLRAEPRKELCCWLSLGEAERVARGQGCRKGAS